MSVGGTTEQPSDSPEFNDTSLDDLEVGEAVDSLVAQAAAMKASDLFFLSDEDRLTISVRRMGMVQEIASVPKDVGGRYIVHIMASADMDIAERRRPADGRLLYRQNDLQIDLRINCMATQFGEDVTLRLLNREETKYWNFDTLGLTRDQFNHLSAMLNSPSGLILVTGPTGTGKTTTLYACLKHLNDGKRKINTIEDPIEYSMPGVRQSQVNPKLEIDFAELLRSVLRQSPDVIMIGEVRDAETAVAAARAANSGHLVFATLHSAVAAGALQSMLSLGVHPHFLSTCLRGVIAQRLVRVLCPNCRREYDLSEAPHTFEEITSLLAPGEGTVMYGPGGCDTCCQVGYTGQQGVFEVMSIGRELRRLVAQSSTAVEVQQKAVATGMVEFRRSSLLKVAQGVTSTEEVLRAVPTEYLGIDE